MVEAASAPRAAAGDGGKAAFELLLTVYQELRRLAAHKLANEEATTRPPASANRTVLPQTCFKPPRSHRESKIFN